MEKDDDDETEEVVLSRVSLDVNKLTAPVERERARKRALNWIAKGATARRLI